MTPLPPPAAARVMPTAPDATKAAEHRHSRDAPVEAVFRSATRLNGGNPRRTRATSCSTSRSGLAYTPGDSFGLFPRERSGARRG